MFATRKVTAEIFSIVGGIRHEFTLAMLESSFRKAYGESPIHLATFLQDRFLQFAELAPW